MQIQMFNGWYFFWIILLSFATVGLYYALKNKSARLQNTVLLSLLLVGLLLHFLKWFIPPYSTNESVRLSESWFVNICGANIGLFPFLFLSKSERVKNYMLYIGIISGFIAMIYPIEPIEKANQLAEQLDIIRFYYHHWMLFSVPLLLANICQQCYNLADTFIVGRYLGKAALAAVGGAFDKVKLGVPVAKAFERHVRRGVRAAGNLLGRRLLRRKRGRGEECRRAKAYVSESLHGRPFLLHPFRGKSRNTACRRPPRS